MLSGEVAGFVVAEEMEGCFERRVGDGPVSSCEA